MRVVTLHEKSCKGKQKRHFYGNLKVNGNPKPGSLFLQGVPATISASLIISAVSSELMSCLGKILHLIFAKLETMKKV